MLSIYRNWSARLISRQMKSFNFKDLFFKTCKLRHSESSVDHFEIIHLKIDIDSFVQISGCFCKIMELSTSSDELKAPQGIQPFKHF